MRHELVKPADVFDYIEMFYNSKCKHVHNGMRSPIEFERQQKLNNKDV
jgi:putative transposase